VEYAEKDELGENLYAQVSGPKIIGRNGGDGLTLALSNDSDVVAKTLSGNLLGDYPTTKAIVTRNGVAVVDSYNKEVKVTLLSVPVEFEENGYYTYE
jgi:hypothetical protein